MIYTSSLDLSPEQRKQPSTAETVRNAAARARSVARQVIEAVREGVARSRAALADHNGFDAQ